MLKPDPYFSQNIVVSFFADSLFPVIFSAYFLKKYVLVFFVLISSLSSSPLLARVVRNTRWQKIWARGTTERGRKDKKVSLLFEKAMKKRENLLFFFFLPGRNGPHFLLFTPLFLFLRRIVVCSSREVGKCPTFTPTSLFFQQFFRLFFFQLEVGNRAVKGTIICENSKWQIPELEREVTKSKSHRKSRKEFSVLLLEGP